MSDRKRRSSKGKLTPGATTSTNSTVTLTGVEKSVELGLAEATVVPIGNVAEVDTSRRAGVRNEAAHGGWVGGAKAGRWIKGGAYINN